jgi:hypothetical protein
MGSGRPMARPSWPSPLLRRRSPLRAVPCPLCLPSLDPEVDRPAGFVGRGLLSWGCHRSAPPSASAPGVHSQRYRCSEELPARRPPRGPAGGAVSPSVQPCHLPDSFRPCRSSRLRRLAPPGAFKVCCTLKPIMGFATFQALRSSRDPRPAVLRLSPSVDRAAVEAALAGARQRRRLAPFTPRRGLWVCGVATSHVLVSVEPSPVALHPSKLSPRRQPFRVNRFLRAAHRAPAPARETRTVVGARSVTRSDETGHRGTCLLVVVRGSGPARFCFPHAGCIRKLTVPSRSTSRP